MTATSRTIAIAVASLAGAGVGGRWTWQTFVSNPLAAFERQAKAAQTNRDNTQKRVLAARLADADLAALEPLCLPGRPWLAIERLQSELIEMMRACNIVSPTLTPSSPAVRSDVTLVSYAITGIAGQKDFFRFLFELRKAPGLRLVRRLSLTPIDRPGMASGIRFSLTVEAPGLGSGAESAGDDSIGRDRRPTSNPAEMASSLAACRGLMGPAALSARGLAPADLPANDPEFVHLTGILLNDSETNAALFDRVRGVSRTLRVGDRTGFAGDDSVVRAIGAREVIVESSGNFFAWKLGTPYALRQPLTPVELIDRAAASLTGDRP